MNLICVEAWAHGVTGHMIKDGALRTTKSAQRVVGLITNIIATH